MIINFEYYNQYQISFLHLKWFKLITIEEISALVCCYWVIRWCIFNIAWNVCILLTIEVIINIDWCNQFQRLFLRLKWLSLITTEEIFGLGFLLLSQWMVYFQYRLKCQYFTDNGGDNKLSLIQSIPNIVFTSEMVHVDENWRNFSLCLLALTH